MPLLLDQLESRQLLSGSATFLNTDTTTQGNWIGNYGSQGYNIIGIASSYPSYATVTPSGQSNWTWATSTTDLRGLQDASGSGRIAACWYSATSFSIDVNLTDGQAHDVALYALDWDNAARIEQVQISDASTGAVLDSERISAFYGGRYLQWNMSGNVVITLTCLQGTNGVISGLFFDPASSPTQPLPPSPSPTATATFVKSDTTTQGDWIGTYGLQGYNIIGNASSYPSYATVTPSGQANWTWATSTTDLRDLQDASDSGRIAACWYSGTSFSINVDLTDGQAHDVTLYALDWDKNGRSEQIQIANASTGAVLDTETISSFSGGEYLQWNMSGNVVIKLTCLAGYNAVISGLFFDPASGPTQPPPPTPTATATFVKSDSTTHGNWIGTYGSQGYNIIGNASSYPSYATVTPSGQANWTWGNSSTDIRDLQDASGSGRIAACWYLSTSFSIDINLTDGRAHDVALYALDWDNAAREEQIQISNASTGAVLDTETISAFSGGEYLQWNISGNVVMKITCLAGPNAVIDGLFFDPPSASGQATPSISWPTPAAIFYGTPLGANQLDATASYTVNGSTVSVPGTFTYSPAAGTLLGAGDKTLSVSFTPNDSTDYSPGLASTIINVQPATPTISWPTPAAIVNGTALNANELDATASFTVNGSTVSVPGTFTYSPAAGTVLGVGNQTLSVSFTPSDSTDYTSGVASTNVNVYQATMTSYDLTNPAVQQYIAMEGCWIEGNYPTTLGFANNMLSGNRSRDGGLRFYGTISQIDLYCLPVDTPVRLTIDGVDTNPSLLLESNTWGWQTGVWTGLDSTAEHEYEIWTGGNASYFYIQQIRVAGTIDTTPLAVRPVFIAYGDSVTMGEWGNSGDSTLGPVHIVGVTTGYQVANVAVGSTQVSGSDPAAGQNRTADVTDFTPAPAVVMIQYGQVDVMNGVDQATFGAAYLAMIKSIRAGLPSAWILCEGLQGTTDTDTSRVPYNATIAADVASFDDPKCLYENNIVEDYNSTIYGLHPDPAGSIVMASLIDAQLAALGASSGSSLKVGGGSSLTGNDGSAVTVSQPTTSEDAAWQSYSTGANGNQAVVSLGTVDLSGSEQAVVASGLVVSPADAGVTTWTSRRRPR
jgi:uncharacterized membrane protein YkoI